MAVEYRRTVCVQAHHQRVKPGEQESRLNPDPPGSELRGDRTSLLLGHGHHDLLSLHSRRAERRWRSTVRSSHFARIKKNQPPNRHVADNHRFWIINSHKDLLLHLLQFRWRRQKQTSDRGRQSQATVAYQAGPPYREDLPCRASRPVPLGRSFLEEVAEEAPA